MTDLLSVLVITYLAGGEIMESEIQMTHAVCVQAAASITAAPEHLRPIVEFMNGDKVPVASATCVPACFADGETLALLSEAEPA